MNWQTDETAEKALTVYLRAVKAAKESRAAREISGQEYKRLCKLAAVTYRTAVDEPGYQRAALAGER